MRWGGDASAGFRGPARRLLLWRGAGPIPAVEGMSDRVDLSAIGFMPFRLGLPGIPENKGKLNSDGHRLISNMTSGLSQEPPATPPA